MTRPLIVLCLALAGCATAAPPPVVKLVEVRVPVPVPCRPDVGPEPTYPDNPEALAAAADIFVAMQLRIAGRTERAAREAVLKAALEGCAGVILHGVAGPFLRLEASNTPSSASIPPPVALPFADQNRPTIPHPDQ